MKRKEIEDANDSSSSGEDIPHTNQVKKFQIPSKDPRIRPASRVFQQGRTPQTGSTPRTSTSASPVAHPWPGKQVDTDNGKVGTPKSPPKESHGMQDNTSELFPIEIQRELCQVLSKNPHCYSQLCSNKLRYSNEKNIRLEAEVLRLKSEVESLHSENGELKKKCDGLEEWKSDVLKAVKKP